MSELKAGTASFADLVADDHRRAAVVTAAADIDLPTGGILPDEIRIAFRTPAGDDHELVIADGRLVAWDLGTESDVVVVQDIDLQLATTTRVGIGNRVLEGTRVLIDDELHRPPPLDDVFFGGFTDLPQAVGATLLAQIEVIGGPFGTATYWQRWVDGRRVGTGLGTCDEQPDIYARRLFYLMIEERAGRLDLLDSLEGGEVRGAWPLLMTFAGLLASPEYLAGEDQAACGGGETLATLGVLLESRGWAQVGSLIGRALDDAGPSSGAAQPR